MASKNAGYRRKPIAQDVAKLAGVSQSTVSRVLCGVQTTFVSEATRQRVIQAASDIGYTPNPMARALRGKHTGLLGLIVNEIADPFFASFISIVTACANSLGYHIVLGHAHSDPSEAIKIGDLFDTRHCDGIVLLGDFRGDEEVTQEIVKGHPAVVALCRGRSPNPVPTVICDSRTGMNLLLDHLYQLGHRRFAFIEDGWLGDTRYRRNCFLDFAQEHQLQFPPEHIQIDTDDPAGGYRAATRVLSGTPCPTALVAADDVLAVGALKAAFDAGMRVPQDISITGFDNIELAAFTCPALTTVQQPIEKMAQRALELLIGQIKDQASTDWKNPEEVLPELIIRQSTAQAASGR